MGKNLKKSICHILKEIYDKVNLINNNKNIYDIRLLCKCLGIHHLVYYYHCNHTTNYYKEYKRELAVWVIRILNESKYKKGSPKTTNMLNN